ncbi:ABC transporter ATP-binding protein [Heliomicrobium gestii]|uniref:ABC transporter ATP-binding protein n=1 Tax=Heliomicrobium gestii TaxID=2699 RepID=UPI00195AD04C|nr:ABC transporter ATP-binding protein [Heliomicrobium gestii]MBM7867417.1 putative spermidine/putrescine transport system ATP-binding protein [Heliomicrobium gestii]
MKGINKRFADQVALRNISLTVEKGEFLTLLGPSGCGKSTLLRVLSGFLPKESGQIWVDGKEISRLPANRRDMGFVFQSYALFPNMSVFENVAFGLKMRNIGKEERRARVEQMLHTVGLGALGHRMPHELSGGQQQRVALARALAPEPSVLLLDEPFSALDAKIRLSMRQFIRELQNELAITTVFVTHDQEEALSISDRIALMREGRIEQVGLPVDLYSRPATTFAAEFIGTTNLFPIARVQENRVYVPFPLVLDRPVPPEICCLAVRPEQIRMALPEPEATESDGADRSSENTGAPSSSRCDALTGTIRSRILLGSLMRYRVQVQDHMITVDQLYDPHQAERYGEGTRVHLQIDPASCVFLAEAKNEVSHC